MFTAIGFCALEFGGRMGQVPDWSPGVLFPQTLLPLLQT